MADQADVLLQFWQEQKTQARQSEDQRAAMTNIVLLIESVGVGFLARSGIRQSAALVSILLFALGVFGAFATAKYYERFGLHVTTAHAYRDGLEEIFPPLTASVERAGKKKEPHDARHPLLRHVEVHVVWIGLHSAIALFGLAWTVLIIARQ